MGIEKYLGSYGKEMKNKNGERLLDLSVANYMVIAYSKFKHKHSHKVIREMPSSSEKSIVEYFLVSR